MSFQSFGFLAFLTLAAIVCHFAGRRSTRLGVLLLLSASCFFYVSGFSQLSLTSFLILLLGVLVSWQAGAYIRRGTERRKPMFVLAVGWHIAVLVLFKYLGFFTGGAVSAKWVPLGLSFFTFQQIWYLKEVYTGEFVPEEPIAAREFELYSLFFPTIASGPILRPGAFFPQLRSETFLRPDSQDIAAGLYAICCGTAKKVLLADSFGIVVNNGWGRLSELSAPAAWLVMLGYTLQLYFDFSGYCDIATGAARLFGLRLPANFDSPYRALSVGTFWKRWHMTLTTFLRECLYFPLGGSRRGGARTYLNIMVIYLVSGIWHGAGWTFILWGGLHGLAQVVERAWGPARDRLPAVIRWGLTFLFVNIAWVFFRAPDPASGVDLLRLAVCGDVAKPEAWLLNGLFSKEVGAMQMLIPAFASWTNILRLLVLYGSGLLVALWPRNAVRQMDALRPSVLRAVLLAAVMVWSILSFTGITTFIYSNF